jgi:hypothetical protein
MCCLEIQPHPFFLNSCQSANITLKRTTRSRIDQAVDKVLSNPNQSINTNRFIYVLATYQVTSNTASPRILRAALLHDLTFYAVHINYLHRGS